MTDQDFDQDDIQVIDRVFAYSLEERDQVIIEGDYVELSIVDQDRPDKDEVFVKGYSHVSGDTVSFPLYAYDEFDLWSV